ncbi:pentatricopeptide repeat-containing protein At1g74750 isoform X2 [Amborella trichopoda]|nr:pentatricopeptide repeat-containing protein At1g74750 isoform X2 [Amborella trichopoda]XP_020517265.1 pentatricopeptide repeat-containing protein At1g74750 isoform X2 [Amborella trichopoda]|eukprot:XP_006829300.2 pentatricopeptide repeat-containing protein At1g74750 isoform X2 [Amborella trichopoda]
MLRPKQLGPLCKGARSFIVSESRSSTVDGPPPTSSEDENSHSRHQPKHSLSSMRQLFFHRISPFACPTSEKAGILVSKGTTPTTDQRDQSHSTSPKVSDALSSSPKGASFLVYGDACDSSIPKDSVSTAMSISEQFIKAGLTTIEFFSDLANFRVPKLDGSGLLVMPSNSMVDTNRAVSNCSKSSQGKLPSSKSAPFSGRPHNIDNSANVLERSTSPVQKVDKRGSLKATSTVEAFQHVNHNDNHPTASNHRQRTKGPHSSSYKVKSPSNSGTGGGDWKVAGNKETKGRVNFVGSGDKVFNHNHNYNLAMPKGVVNGGGNVRFSPMNSGITVEQAFHILECQKWGAAAETALANLKGTLNAYLANQVLKRLQGHQDSVALGFFYWLKRQPGFKHDEHSYTTMIGILGRAKKFSAMNRLLDEMSRDGCTPNVVTYNRLIHCYGRANHHAEAVKVFYQMQKLGIEPDRVTYCTLIDMHSKAGFLDDAMDMYARMQDAGLSPDTFTYSVIINCLGKAGRLASAYGVFCEMVERGCVPNLVTYNIMIALHAKARNYPTALKLYRNMQAVGFRPDKVTYNIIMEVLGCCGCLEEAEAVFAEMEHEKWTPDEPAYGLMIDMWGKSGDADRAWGWFEAMLRGGLHPNVPTCNSMLSAFLRAQRFADALTLLDAMRMVLGLQPSLQTYTLLLSCCTDALLTRSNVGACLELMLVAVAGHPTHTFLLHLPGAEPGGGNIREHAGGFLDAVRAEEREGKRGLVDAVIDFLHKAGLKEEAGWVWEAAVQKEVYAQAVREERPLWWVINLHMMSEGTAVTALSRTLAWLRRGMLESGVGPRRVDIVTGWGKRSRVTGSSFVRQAVQHLLCSFGFPFLMEKGNSGCFVGCGEPLGRWLSHSYVERMHLL